MNWLTPGLAGVAAAITIPSLLILYFLKLRRRDVEVSTTLLWKKSIQDIQANAPFQKLRKNILLFLQLLVLGAALVAIAQPRVTGDAPPPDRTVILIDRSASMSAMDETINGAPASRLQRAKQHALALVDAMRDGGVLDPGGGDQAMVVAFAANAEIVLPYTSNKARLVEAINAIEATDEPTDFEDVMRIAGGFIRPTTVESERTPTNDDMRTIPGAPIALFSDGAIAGLRSVEKHADSEFRFIAVGTSDAVNLAITAIGAERAYDRPERVSVFVGLQSTDPQPRTVDVEFGIDGAIGMVKAARISAASAEAPGRGGVVFQLDRTEAAVVTARIVSNDALEADNTARLVIPPAKRLSVALVTAGNYYLRNALNAIGVSKIETISSDEFQHLRDRDELARFDVYVLDNWLPPLQSAQSDSAENLLPPGNYLIIGKTPALPGLTTTTRKIRTTGFVDWERDHPSMRYLSLGGIVIGDAPVIEAGREVRVIASTGAGPAIVDASRGASNALIVTFDMSRSTWPLDPGYILFLSQAVRFLGDQGGAAGASALQPGAILTERLPDGVHEARLRTPTGGQITLRPGPDRRVSFGPVQHAGLYELSWTGQPGPRDPIVAGRPTRAIAVNLADASESLIASVKQLELPSGKVLASNTNDAPGRETRRLWPWILIVALGFLMLEWFVYNRKVYL